VFLVHKQENEVLSSISEEGEVVVAPDPGAFPSFPEASSLGASSLGASSLGASSLEASSLGGVAFLLGASSCSAQALQLHG